LTDLAEDGSEDGTCTPTEKGASTIQPVPTKKDTGTIPPALTRKEAVTSPPAPTRVEASTSPKKLTTPAQKGTPMPDQAATPSSERCSSNDEDIQDEDYVSCFLECLSFERTAREYWMIR